MSQLAVYNAVAATSHSGRLYQLDLKAPKGGSAVAAAVEAAYRVDLSLYPSDAAVLNAMKQETLSTVPCGQARAMGIKIGDKVAAAMIALRANDHATDTVAYTPRNTAGRLGANASGLRTCRGTPVCRRDHFRREQRISSFGRLRHRRWTAPVRDRAQPGRVPGRGSTVRPGPPTRPHWPLSGPMFPGIPSRPRDTGTRSLRMPP